MNTLLIIYFCLFFVGYGIGIVSAQKSPTTEKVIIAIITGIFAPIAILKCIGEILLEVSMVLEILIIKFTK